MQGAFEFHQDLRRRPERPERLFFALFPDRETSLCVEQFGQRFFFENHLEGRRLKTERLHLSLHHIEDYTRLRTKMVYASTEAARTVSTHPFEVTFRFVTSLDGAPPKNGRPPRWPLVLLGEGDALLEFRGALGVAMRKIGLKTHEHFVPHMTLAYSPEWIPAQAIEPISFVVSEFCLIHSRLWLTQYNVIDRWPLLVH